MCGICGFNFEDKTLIKKMCNLISHRGPDDEGFFLDAGVSLGVRRLSILDLKTGHQPQHNENEDMWIIFNGEIFNFKELKNQLETQGHIFYTKSDTEVIIHAYEEWGEDCVKKLRGQFAFCIFDSIKKTLLVCRDHLGIKPLYYFFDGKRFIFGSEIKTILCHNIKREVSKKALNLFFSLKYVPFNQTLFKGILKLPPASYLIFNLKNQKIQINNYWDLSFQTNREKNIDELAKELRALLEESIKIRLTSDVPLGAFLSGGIDSSAIVALMSGLMEEPVRTFSIGFEEEAQVNETKYARIVADLYNTDHTEIIVKSTISELLPKLVWHLDDLIADAAIIPIYLMAKSAKQYMTVALTGDGADEVFAGYSVYYRRQKYNFINSVPKNIFELMFKFYDYIPFHIFRIGFSYLYQSKTLEDRYLRKIIHIPDEEKSKLFPYETESIQKLVKAEYIKSLDLINQFTNWDLKFQLPNQFNMKLDKMSMAASLEARVPYLDYKMVEFASTIPSEFKLKGNIEKYILRLAVKDKLPPVIVKRKKAGFNTPVHYWIKTGLRELSGNMLDNLKKRKNLINPKYIKSVKRNRFLKTFENRAWNSIMFELWYETFIENDGSKPIIL